MSRARIGVIPVPDAPYKRTPSDHRSWAVAAQNKFPIFGFAEVLLNKSDAELVRGFRECPEASAEMTMAFEGVGRRWLDGAEDCLFMSQRMQAAHSVYAAETGGGRKRSRSPKRDA